MSKRITITLTDEEYTDLERRAQTDRRSVRDMAARLVTQGPEIRIVPTTPYSPLPTMPWLTWTSATNGSTNPVCPACTDPNTSADHICVRAWNTIA